MYTAYIGRRIIDLYNEHINNRSPLEPKDFFDEVFFPVFFDHKKYLMWVNNAPFDQAYKQRKNTPLTEEVRRERLQELHEKAEQLTRPLSHLVIGGIDSSPTDYRSGQTTAISFPADADEVYTSWVGAAAGIGVSGGLSLLIDDDRVLLALLEGWKQCRRFMQQTPNIKPHRVNSWNGWWITHRFGPDYYENDPLRDFDPKLKKSRGELEFGTQDWAQVLFALAGDQPEVLLAYVYSIGYRGNTTIGFRQLLLPEVKNFTDLYEELFGDVEGVTASRLADVFKPEYSIYQACEQGAIGLKALRPDKLRNYVPGRRDSKMPDTTRSKIKFTRYLVFQTWIIAMLNNEDLIDTTEQLAKALREHAESDTKGRKTAQNRAEQVLDASHQREFLEALTEVVENEGSHADLFDEIADEVVKMPSSDFPLFATLLRLKYKVFSQQQSV